MRTTIRIDDQLFRQLKERAAKSGRTIGTVIEDALRVAFQRNEGARPSLDELPVFGSLGTMPGVDLESNSALLDLMESEDGPDAAL